MSLFIEIVLVRLIKSIFFLFCFAVLQTITVLFVVGFASEESIVITLIGNLIVVLPWLVAIPGWIIGVPPAPTLVLRELDFFFGLQMFAIMALTGFGIYLRVVFFEGGSFQRFWTVITQGILSLLIFLLPFVWTVRDGRLASMVTQSIEQLHPGKCPDTDTPVLLAQISDLHVTSNGQPTREGGVAGNKILDPLLEAINKHHPAFLLVTGDVTDSGAAAEWHNILFSLNQVNRDSIIMLTPGNHDLNLAFGREPVTVAVSDDNTDFLDRLEEIPRIARVYAVQSKFTPTIVSKDGSTLTALLSQTPTRATASSFSSEIEECTESCVTVTAGPDMGVAKARWGCYYECKKSWGYIRNLYLRNLDEEFPWRYIDEKRGVAIFSIATSLRKTDTIGQNAIGEIGDAQLAALESAIRAVPADVKVFVFMFHHPVTNVRGEDASVPVLASSTMSSYRSLFKRASVVWQDMEDSVWWARMFLRANPQQANKFLKVLDTEMRRRGDAHGIVMFGHRHMRTLGVWNNLFFVEAPNVSHIPPDRGFYLVTIDVVQPTISWCPLESK